MLPSDSTPENGPGSLHAILRFDPVLEEEGFRRPDVRALLDLLERSLGAPPPAVVVRRRTPHGCAKPARSWSRDLRIWTTPRKHASSSCPRWTGCWEP